MAGSEKSGWQVARSDLFRGATVIVTPTDATEPRAIKGVTALWEALGARVSALDPETHDRTVAAISHLPHVAAWALVDAVGRFEPGALAFAARGFRDTTRIAASDPPMWRDVLLANADAVRESLRPLLAALEVMGVEVGGRGPGHHGSGGAGLGGLVGRAAVVDCGNSGTTVRLLIGVLAGQPFWTLLTGDESLRGRPMKRVAEPLTLMGATIVGRSDGGRLPLAVRGAALPRAIAYDTPVASAQVKSAILLAGLRADGPVTVREPAPSRDHSEVMLRAFGARLERPDTRTVTLHPGPLSGAAVQVPGDISSAARLLVAGLVRPHGPGAP